MHHLALSTLLALHLIQTPSAPNNVTWITDPVWHDGLVEKATYKASRVIYGQPRPYTAIFFTNKEQHDCTTWTKASKSTNTMEVFKHNQIEDIPTPNYTYHFVTTSHLTTNGLLLTAFQHSSQEFCGTSFRLLKATNTTPGQEYHLTSFSYMPEAGLNSSTFRNSELPLIPEDTLPLYLRNFPFADGTKVQIRLLPSQKSNRPTPTQPFAATLRYAGLDNNLHKVELVANQDLRGVYWLAPDRLHVMVRYESADRTQTYELQSQERTDYWTLPPSNSANPTPPATGSSK